MRRARDTSSADARAASVGCPGTGEVDSTKQAYQVNSYLDTYDGKFLPGSQTQDHLQHVDTFHKDNLLSRGQEIAVKVDGERTVDCILNPGEMSLHHVKLVHGSEPNRSNDRRIGLAISTSSMKTMMSSR